MKPRYKAAIFDLDGTLLDSMIYWRRQNLRFLAKRGLALPEELRGCVLDTHSAEAARIYIEKFGLDMKVEDIISEYERDMRGYYATEIPLKRGLPEFFERLKRAGVRMCVATMTPSEVARIALSRHGVLEYMEFVTCTYEQGRSKSESAFFEAVRARLGVEAEACAVFEDAVYAARSAHGAGMDVYAVYDATARMHADELRALSKRYVLSFDELFDDERLFGAGG